MEALLGAAVAVGACCGIPLLLVGGAALINRGKRGSKAASDPAARKGSVLQACCTAPWSLAKGTASLVFNKKTRKVRSRQASERVRP